ncbi:hypothetical protein FQA39_LY19293 [Lamprigera yunnana]|nr:hypothetical protein FQA39_LY19293 [Lamprigera yunnana]
MTKLETKTEKRRFYKCLWDVKRSICKDIHRAFARRPEPHYNTISTMVRLAWRQKRKKNTAKPCRPESDSGLFRLTPTKNMVFIFAKQDNLSADDLREILEMIEKGGKKMNHPFDSNLL